MPLFMLQYAMSKNMSLQNGDFRPFLALKWQKSQKIHITEAFKCQNQKVHSKLPQKTLL